jgi:L-threonylcarbamoyladenylate synthase
MLARHYAPRTPVELFNSRGELDRRTEEPLAAGKDVGRVHFGEPNEPGTAVGMPADPADYAARLYAVLHDLDAQNLSRILVEQPPDTAEWLAVRDRLQRAATN